MHGDFFLEIFPHALELFPFFLQDRIHFLTLPFRHPLLFFNSTLYVFLGVNASCPHIIAHLLLHIRDDFFQILACVFRSLQPSFQACELRDDRGREGDTLLVFPFQLVDDGLFILHVLSECRNLPVRA